MKTLIAIIILGTITLTSCAYPTQKEIEDKQKICDINGEKLFISDGSNEMSCEPKTSVMDCIKEYTDGIDEKYNNPDTVSDLREDDYSKVVKTCNEIFGEKPEIK